MKNEQTPTLVTVAVVNQLPVATILQYLLEEAGIMVFLQNELMSQLYGGNAVGGVVIQVPDTDAEKARQLLIEGGYV